MASEKKYGASPMLSRNVNGLMKLQPKYNSIPKRRQDLLKWNGWGYNDTTLIAENGQLYLTGDRYKMNEIFISEKVRAYFQSTLNMDIYKGFGPNKSQPIPSTYPNPTINKEFMNDIVKMSISFSMEGEDRYFHAHGHTIHELMKLRQGRTFDRIPDLIVWPGCHSDVVQLVQLASRLNVVIVPFGGGTNVTRALECPSDETRMIVSLDTSQMSRLLWLDKNNMLVCCEAGILGQNLERELKKYGLIMGHEPDSLEFSSLGGWVATRASGMKKNQYGNIEDLVVHVRLVTPVGVLEKTTPAPRVSCGPDLHHVALGSEGTLGVITEVTFKVQPIPEVQEFDSFLFYSFKDGVDFMREVAFKRCQPASLRLIDNEQFKMGQLYREKMTWLGSMIDSIKMIYVTSYKRFDLDSLCVAIAVYEGDLEDVAILKNKITRIASQYGGCSAGAKNGERGYKLTFSIAYIRDYCLSHYILAESFETSIPWDRTIKLCKNVKNVISKKCKDSGITYYLTSCRVTQLYDTGACVYFYFAFNSEGRNLKDALQTYEQIEEAAREEILACGGSLSHHHGIGKLRSKWYPRQVSPVGVAVYRAIKQTLDPNNVFACGNLLPEKHVDTKMYIKKSNNHLKSKLS